MLCGTLNCLTENNYYTKVQAGWGYGGRGMQARSNKEERGGTSVDVYPLGQAVSISLCWRVFVTFWPLPHPRPFFFLFFFFSTTGPLLLNLWLTRL